MKALSDLKLIKLLILAAWSFSLGQVEAQIPQIDLNHIIDGERVTDRLSAVTTSDLKSPEKVWNILKSEGFTGDYNFGFTEEYHWVGFSVNNRSESVTWMVEVENPHINEIHFYVKHDGGWIQLDQTGRATPFSTRRVAHFNYIFPLDLQQGNSADLLLMFDKRRSSISYHTKLWSLESFNKVQQIHYASYGIYFGMFLLIIFITAIAYFISYNKLYIFYLLYVLSVGLFVFNDTGLGHQFIYPGSADIGGAARIVLTYAVIITFLRFTQYYFNTAEFFPEINRILNLFTCAIIAHGLVYYFFTDWFQTNATFMIILLYSTVIMAIGVALYTSALYLKREKYVAILFVTAFSFIFFAGLIFILTEFGFLPEIQLLFTPIQIGSALEIMFLSIGLAWRVRVVEREQIDLKDRINRLKTEKLVAYIEGTEEERNRIAMDLHDSIGNRLGNLKRIIESGKQSISHTVDELKQIMSDVRSISHKLSPPSMNLTGIENSIKQLVAQTNESSNIKYSFQSIDVPEKISEEISMQIFRIAQEAIQNIEKHSCATGAEIQLIGHPDELVLTIEDNGVGIESNVNHTNGIGLVNIKKRVDYLGGNLEMTYAKNRGVQLLISLPLSSAITTD